MHNKHKIFSLSSFFKDDNGHFVPHMSYTELYKLKVNDMVNVMDSSGKFRPTRMRETEAYHGYGNSGSSIKHHLYTVTNIF